MTTEKKITQTLPPFFKPLKFLKSFKAEVADLNLPSRYLELFLEPIELTFKELLVDETRTCPLFYYDKSLYEDEWKEKRGIFPPCEDCFRVNEKLFYDTLYDNADNFNEIQDYVNELRAFEGLELFKNVCMELEEQAEDYLGSYDINELNNFCDFYDFSCKLMSLILKNTFYTWTYCKYSGRDDKIKPILKEFFNETCLRYCWSPHTKIGKKRVEKLYDEMNDY